MANAYKEYWRNMFNMEGRATRSQFWWPQLVNIIVVVVYLFASELFSFRYSSFFYMGLSILMFAIWIANFSIRARRLHDRDHSNWWLLLYLLPRIGSLIIFIQMLLPSVEDTRWPVNQSFF
ncbi:DUF805 domain-containing protein [Enterococcus sp. HY326]|uniref:DUF805 domain-containing protein n=1 Tax=Enterococcus sp. HY326 TaxID=2971265 RepID=UPI002240477F|nr:DUF805 domain-containing protein [Enterococcus sp. HY326]